MQTANSLPDDRQASTAQQQQQQQQQQQRTNSLTPTIEQRSSKVLGVDRQLLEPYLYLRKLGGKDFRSKMINAFNSSGWLHVPEDHLSSINRVVGMLHEASLLVDDVEDGSELRRGAPVAHSIFGVAATINSANLVYFLAMRELSVFGVPGLMDTFCEELIKLHCGQGMEIYWRDNVVCPQEDEFLEMVRNKTGGLLRLGIKLMQQLADKRLTIQSDNSNSGNSEDSSKSEDVVVDFVPLVNLIGEYFQVRDDLINLQSTAYAENKGFCEDITEGKFSFPIIHGIRTSAQAHPDSSGSDRELINILKQRTTSVELKKYAIRIMEQTGSFEYTRNYLMQLENEIREMIQKLGGNDKLTAIMDFLTEGVNPNSNKAIPIKM